MNDIIEIIISASTWVLPVLLAVTLHEAAHGFAAKLFGDDTAQRAGRLSLNPIRHIDPVGTILIPGLLLLTGAPFLFGYAKPVPVAFHRLHPQRLGVIGVAVAGPATNVALAIASILLLVGLPSFSPAVNDWLATTLQQSIWLNCILAVFNMLPIGWWAGSDGDIANTNCAGLGAHGKNRHDPSDCADLPVALRHGASWR